MVASLDLSPGYLLASLVVSSVGFGLFIYGKKQVRIPHLVAGVGLMVYPYFVTNVWAMLGICGLVLAGTWGVVRAGH
jgi:hypothetical protein